MSKSSCSMPIPPLTTGAFVYAATPASLNDQIAGGNVGAAPPLAFSS